MANVAPITEQFQHFVRDLKETFWGDLYGKTRLMWERFWEEESRRERDRYVAVESYERAGEKRRSYRNGFYWRDFVTRLGTLRLQVARARDQSFLPKGLERFQRRAEEGMMLIREAFLRVISTRQVGRVVGIVTGEVVSAQTVSKVSRSLDRLVKAFQRARLKDEWASSRANAGRLRSAARREPATAGLPAQRGREPGGLGRLIERPVRAGAHGEPPAADRHRWLCGLGGGDSDRLSAREASALLGAQDAEHFGEGAPLGSRRGEGRSASDLPRRESPGRASRFPSLSVPLARGLSGDGEAPGEGFARAAHLLRLPASPLAQAPHHQCHREVFRGSATPHAAHGLLRQCRQRGSDYLCHLQRNEREV